MIECPHCYRVFRATPEKVGARCPKCRQPLFERSSKRRTNDRDLGACARHPESAALAKCTRCGRLMCVTCRTRWHEEATCPECIDRCLTSGAATPQETQRQERHAWTGLVLAIVGWFLALMVLWPVVSLRAGSSGTEWWVNLGTFFFFASFVPALVALGQSTAALRLRGQQATIALAGLVASGLQLGLLVGVIVLNLWFN